MDIQDEALVDWVKLLLPFSRTEIERACDGYLAAQPRRRPTPGDIRNRAKEGNRARSFGHEVKGGDRSALSQDELHLLDGKILPTAWDWVRNSPGLREHGLATLRYWGEPIPAEYEKGNAA